MTEQEWLEVPVFIHGVVSDTETEDHKKVYGKLLELINNELEALKKPKFNSTLSIMIEWGFSKSRGEDSQLGEAQSLIKKKVIEVSEKVTDLTINPLRLIHNVLRQVFLISIGDMFYYVSMDGEKAVRENVFNSIYKQIVEVQQNHGSPKISLSIFAHSAGTVIAHDLLYHLFREKGETENEIKNAIEIIHRLIVKDQLRIRRFYTMGSPITPLIIRAKSLIKKIVNDKLLNPEDIGLRKEDELNNPRWINFWDKDDVFSFPVAFFYKLISNESVVEDKYIDFGDCFPKVHGEYWTSKEMAKYIAKTF